MSPPDPYAQNGPSPSEKGRIATYRKTSAVSILPNIGMGTHVVVHRVSPQGSRQGREG